MTTLPPQVYPTMTPFGAVSQLKAAVATDAALKEAAKSTDSIRPFTAGVLIVAYYRHRPVILRQRANRLFSREKDEAVLGVVQAFWVNNSSLSSSQVADFVRRR